MFTAEQSTLLSLIRSALWGQTPPEDPETAFEEAKKQALVPLLFPDSSAAKRFSAHTIRLLFAQDELTGLLRSADIPAVILKGSAAAVYYPEPFLRTMGDIDFIVPPDRFQDTSDLLAANGYELFQDLDETDRHRCYRKDGIDLELHHHFSYEGIDVEKYVLEGLSRVETVDVEGHSVPILPALENGMVLLAHVASHLREELGLRQVIDWMMFVNAVLDDETWNARFQPAASECGLEKVAVNVTRMCQIYLGLPETFTWCGGADDDLARDLMSIILRSGNFGHVHGSGAALETATTNFKRFGFFRYLQKAGEHNWRAYHRHPRLKPLCRFYQIFRYLKQFLRSGRKGEKLKDDLDRSRSRYELLKRLGID